MICGFTEKGWEENEKKKTFMQRDDKSLVVMSCGGSVFCKSAGSSGERCRAKAKGLENYD